MFLDKFTEFSLIKVEDYHKLKSFYDKAGYDACEYDFATLYMWSQVYSFRYCIKGDILIILGEYGDEVFVEAPICDIAVIDKGFDYVDEIFGHINRPINVKVITGEVVEYVKTRYEMDKYTVEYSRDYSDYVYESEKLISLSGKKLSAKRNHLNAFYNEYSDRYIYRRLDQSEYHSCIEISKRWSDAKGIDSSVIDELNAIKIILDAVDYLDYLVVSGIFIDGELEAFTIGNKMKEDMAVIHVEKANPNIRGLYAAINKCFVENEFSEVTYINREEDLGLSGLRDAKSRYRPIFLVDKYQLIEINVR